MICVIALMVHCVVSTEAGVQVLLGEHDTSTPRESQLVRRNVAQIRDHSQYDHFTTNYDFSLLRLTGVVSFTRHSSQHPPWLVGRLCGWLVGW